MVARCRAGMTRTKWREDGSLAPECAKEGGDGMLARDEGADEGGGCDEEGGCVEYASKAVIARIVEVEVEW